MNTIEKKVSHTPGPWKINDTPDEDQPYKIIIHDGIFRIALVYKDGKAVYLPESIAEANAKLIAAAPELLKALQMLDECLSDGIPLEKNDPCHRRIKEEIKKATE